MSNVLGVDRMNGLKTNPNEWEKFLTTEADDYLRVYAFFVEEGRIPSDSDSTSTVAPVELFVLSVLEPLVDNRGICWGAVFGSNRRPELGNHNIR